LLARLPVGRHGLPREFVERNQRNRLMAAALEVFATRGYAEGSVADVIAAAGVSRTVFYAHFADKEACLLATYDVLVDWLAEEAAGVPAAEDWVHRVVAVVGSLAARLSADPRLARLLTVEILRAGAPARARHEEVVGRLADALAGGRDCAADMPPTSAVLEPLLVSGAIGFAARLVDSGMAGRLADLASELSEVLLAPFLGRAAAHRIAVPVD
jgi:AcrR family transcriptional regulator